MNDGSAGKIDCSDLRLRIPDPIHPAIDSPYHVGNWKIHGKHPHADENKHGCKFHPLRNCADDQRRRNDGKHQLIHRKDILRDPVRVIIVRSRADAVQKSKFESADERRPTRKNERIAHDPPKDRHQACDAETLGQNRQDVLRADEPAIKERQPRQGHEKHERGARHHPGIMAGAGTCHVGGHRGAGIGAAR